MGDYTITVIHNLDSTETVQPDSDTETFEDQKEEEPNANPKHSHTITLKGYVDNKKHKLI
jgi:hypothetical protein